MFQHVEADDFSPDHPRARSTAVAHGAASASGPKIGMDISADGEFTLHHVVFGRPPLPLASTSVVSESWMSIDGSHVSTVVPSDPLSMAVAGTRDRRPLRDGHPLFSVVAYRGHRYYAITLDRELERFGVFAPVLVVIAIDRFRNEFPREAPAILRWIVGHGPRSRLLKITLRRTPEVNWRSLNTIRRGTPGRTGRSHRRNGDLASYMESVVDQSVGWSLSSHRTPFPHWLRLTVPVVVGELPRTAHAKRTNIRPVRIAHPPSSVELVTSLLTSAY